MKIERKREREQKEKERESNKQKVCNIIIKSYAKRFI